MTDEETEAAIEALVETRYPYEVANILAKIEDDRDRVVVVAAALARSERKGRERGVQVARQNIRERLGL